MQVGPSKVEHGTSDIAFHDARSGLTHIAGTVWSIGRGKKGDETSCTIDPTLIPPPDNRTSPKCKSIPNQDRRASRLAPGDEWPHAFFTHTLKTTTCTLRTLLILARTFSRTRTLDTPFYSFTATKCLPAISAAQCSSVL